MRHVARDWSLAPDYLTLPETVRAVRELGGFLESGGVSARQAYLELDAGQILRTGAEELVRALREQFGGKCAFTEVQIDDSPDPAALHLLRPAQGARGERGKQASDRHYWWLVNQWSNLYLVTPEVASLKGDVFPVDGTRQALATDPLDRGLLLDPCRDLPEWYLRFGDSGGVNSHAPVDFDEQAASEHRRRGEVSIRLFGLSSPEMKRSRVRALAEAAPGADRDDKIMESLLSLDDRTEHLGAIRQMLARRVLRLDTRPSDELVEQLRPELGALAWCQKGATEELAQLLDAGDALAVFAVPRREFDEGPMLAPEPEAAGLIGADVAPIEITIPVATADASAQPPAAVAPVQPEAAPAAVQPVAVGIAPQSLAPKIKRVTVQDFKAIHQLEVEIGATSMYLSEPNRFQRLYEELSTQHGEVSGFVHDAAKPVVQTRVFIGENGSGKSSVLQAIALTLASDVERAAVDEDLKDLIRWDLTDEGPKPNKTRQAKVTVELAGATFTLTIKPDGQVLHEAVDDSGNPIDTSGQSPWFLMRAYSATRTLKGEDSSHEPLSIQNLFDPRVPLVKPEDWLLSLDEQQFGTVAATLHQLFNESNSDGSSPVATAKMSRVPAEDPKKIIVGNVELRHLSDGYRAVITLLCDIMAAAQALNPTDMRSAEGIVMIDEIGAHLHPRWRTRISSLVRREFARMQIIVSTHEPLCMRGFLGGEVILVERDAEEGVRLTPIERNPTGLRVDQLLTSEFFGLYTTLDPEENDRLNLYYQLRAKQAQQGGELKDWEADLLERVRPLETEQVFGYSYREQLTYEAIDTYLTERRARISPEDQRLRRDAAFKEVSEIWRAFERTRDTEDQA